MVRFARLTLLYSRSFVVVWLTVSLAVLALGAGARC